MLWHTFLRVFAMPIPRQVTSSFIAARAADSPSWRELKSLPKRSSHQAINANESASGGACVRCRPGFGEYTCDSRMSGKIDKFVALRICWYSCIRANYI